MGTKLLLTSWPIFWWPRNCGLYLLSCPCFLLLLISCLEELWVLVMRGKKKPNIFCSCFHDFYLFGCDSSVSFHYDFCLTVFSVVFEFGRPCQTFFLSDWSLASTGMFQSLAYLDSDVIDNSEKKKKIKSDLKLNHTQGQLKCFFKLLSCCTGWCWKTVRSDHCFTSVIDGRTDEGGLPCGSDSKESACSEGDPGLIPGLRRFPWIREWQLTPVFWPGESHGWRSLVGYTARGLKDMPLGHDWGANTLTFSFWWTNTYKN